MIKTLFSKLGAVSSAITLLLVLGVSDYGQAGGKGGGGKPPPEPTPSDPAIAYVVGTTSTGTWGDMMVMDADGSNQTVVVPGGLTRPVSPSWSPDGRSLVYSHYFNGECTGLHVVSMDQSGNWGTPQPLVVDNHCIRAVGPAWAPDDGSGIHRVVYEAAQLNDSPGSDIYMIRFTRDNNGLVSVVGDPEWLYGIYDRGQVYSTQPTWSPDGNKITFIESDWTSQPVEALIILNLSDWTVQRLTSLGYSLNRPSWAKTPANQDLLIVSHGVWSQYDLWCINVNDPSQTINLTERFDQQEKLNDVDASWSPDDRKIVFARSGVAMTVTIETGNGCPSATDVAGATLTKVAEIKGRKSMYGLDWRR